MNAMQPPIPMNLALGFPPPRWAALCMLALVLAVQILAGCGGSGGGAGDAAAAPEDTVAPFVQAVDPTHGAVNVPRSAAIRVTFSEPMDAASAESALETLPAVSGTYLWDETETVLTLSPDALLNDDTEFRVTVTQDAQDRAGVPLEEPVTAYFLTVEDFVPYVVRTVPESGEDGTSVTLPFRVEFSEPMDPASTAAALQINPPVDGTVTFLNGATELRFTPDPAYAEWTSYGVTIGTGAKDLTGNGLAMPDSFSFSTGAANGDTTPPTVTAFSPANSASNVARSSVIEVTFSEAMDRATAEGAFWTFPAVAGALSWNAASTVLTLTPDGLLPDDTEMVVAVENTARDASGVWLAQRAEALFYVENDFVPFVISSVPEHGESYLHPDLVVRVLFSEPMDAASTSAAFSISPYVAGTITYTSGGAELVFTPSARLPEATDFTVTIGTGARDRTDKYLASPFSFSFSTGVVIQ